ncbi:MAG: prepilin-type N-terminal cleavage/methylation domain-containing protein [Rubrivivax sp.]|nr:prepilin-type N-terminal cleavage/methylation domain-containing protein [Rubrivivax sp.]
MQGSERQPFMPQTTGVTLIELMVVVALIAIVLALAAPSFQRLIE